jgi:hypothetical protein
MNLHMQLIRAAVALAIIAGVATAEAVSSSPASATIADADCPFTKTVKPQRILLLDPIQRHPTWIDARRESSGDETMHKTVDARDHALGGVVAS